MDAGTNVDKLSGDLEPLQGLTTYTPQKAISQLTRVSDAITNGEMKFEDVLPWLVAGGAEETRKEVLAGVVDIIINSATPSELAELLTVRDYIQSDPHPVIAAFELLIEANQNLKGAVPVLTDYLVSSDPLIRLTAIKALWTIGSDAKPAAQRLAYMLFDDNPSVAAAAVPVLFGVEADPKLALDALVKRIIAHEDAVGTLASTPGHALDTAQIRVPGYGFFSAQEMLIDFNVACALIDSIGDYGTYYVKMLPILTRALLTFQRPTEPEFISQKIGDLILINDADMNLVVPPLLLQLSDPDPRLCQRAILLLRTLGDQINAAGDGPRITLKALARHLPEDDDDFDFRSVVREIVANLEKCPPGHRDRK